jgi:hypothetical protein
MAASGIEYVDDELSSVASTVPPQTCTAVAPVAPSWPPPARITAMARSPNAVAEPTRASARVDPRHRFRVGVDQDDDRRGERGRQSPTILDTADTAPAEPTSATTGNPSAGAG